MTLDDRCARLLPPDAPLHFVTLLLEDSPLTLVAVMTAPKAVCPACHPRSHRLPSGSPRPLAALPWALLPVQLLVHVRRFVCDTSGCERTTCTERLPTVAPLYARTTMRVSHRQASTGLALGGAAGARQLARPHLPRSRHTVRRRGRTLPTPAYPPPHVVGIADGAWRTGHRDGPIVVDLERGGPLDGLADRLAEPGADGLRAHPAGQSVARDRAAAYAAGLRPGAPEAPQVADRVPLLHTLAATLAAVVSAPHPDRAALPEATRPTPVPLAGDAVAVLVAPPGARPNARQQRAQRRARRWALYAQGRA
jgi:transposase